MPAMDLSGALVDFLAWWRWLLNYPLLELGDRALTPGLLLLLVTLLLLVWLVEIPLRRFVLRRVLGRTRLEPAMQYAVARLAGYLFILLGWFVALQTLGINLSSLALFAGALGVGLGFGLQNIVSNFISGIILLAERPVAVGDRVEVGSVAGRITQINLRSTMVITNDNISIIVPNSEFVSSQVVNWSHGDPKVRMRLPVGIAYGSDVEKFRRAMLEVARAHPAVLPQPEPFVYFIGFGDSSLDFEVSVWTIDLAGSPRRRKQAPRDRRRNSLPTARPPPPQRFAQGGGLGRADRPPRRPGGLSRSDAAGCGERQHGPGLEPRSQPLQCPPPAKLASPWPQRRRSGG
jgi:small-conductance mechanosensitive channel